ncbi:MAG: hypothetical protein ACRD4K_11935 [Candidatus Acidiferrales bacterium]
MNRKIKSLAFCSLVAVFAFIVSASGCRKNAADKVAGNAGDQDAIRASIEKHLTTLGSINVAAMDRDYKQISVTGDQAQADVEFKLKQGGATMEMTYQLERHAGDWVVLKSHPAGGQFEHPPMDKTHSGVPADAPTSGMPDIHSIIKATETSGAKQNPAGAPPAKPAEKPAP